MNITQPSRRLLQTTTSIVPSTRLHALLPICQQHRTFIFNRKKKKDIIDPTSSSWSSRLDAAKKEEQARRNPTPDLNSGALAPSSIFEKELAQAKSSQAALPQMGKGAVLPPVSDKNAKATARDPSPKARMRWHRKMIIRDIKGRHRMNKTEKVLRSERFHLSKSPFVKTSVKKMYPLARQIAGRPLQEAMVQMRFSKKKAAADVLKHLELARAQAVISKGMGLGKQEVEGDGAAANEGGGEKQSILVEDKKGRKRVVEDPSAMYVDEAWVGRGKYEFGTDYRAKGRSHRLHLPWTSISVVLKEEATRIRQMKEREEKRQRKKVWVPLPDRPVTAQRQFPLW